MKDSFFGRNKVLAKKSRHIVEKGRKKNKSSFESTQAIGDSEKGHAHQFAQQQKTTCHNVHRRREDSAAPEAHPAVRRVATPLARCSAG